MKKILVAGLCSLFLVLAVVVEAGMDRITVNTDAVAATITTNSFQAYGTLEAIEVDVAASATVTVTVTAHNNTYFAEAGIAADAFYMIRANAKSIHNGTATNQWMAQPVAGLVTVTVQDDAAVITNSHTINFFVQD